MEAAVLKKEEGLARRGAAAREKEQKAREKKAELKQKQREKMKVGLAQFSTAHRRGLAQFTAGPPPRFSAVPHGSTRCGAARPGF